MDNEWRTMIREAFTKNWLLPVAYIYIFLPVIIFALTWTHFYIGIPVAALIIWGIYSTLVNDSDISMPEEGRASRITLAAVILVIVMWVLTSGTGAAVVQYPDHLYRNAIYKILVDNPWPVRMESADGDVRGLIYYIGFWLPAALMGKSLSYEAGFLFQIIWAALGIFLTWYFFCEKKGKQRLWYLIAFIFFGGADLIGRLLSGSIYADIGNRYEWWAIIYNYPGISTHLFWVFNQVVYGWLIYCLIDRQTNNRSILFIWSAALLTCPFPAAGMVPFAMLKGYENAETEAKEKGAETSGSEKSGRQEDKRTGSWRDGAARTTSLLGSGIKESLTLCNGAGLIITAFTSGYVLSNMAVSATMPDVGQSAAPDAAAQAADGAAAAAQNTAAEFGSYGWLTSLWLYLLFALIEFGLYYFVIYRSQGKRRIYWLCLAVLMACPLIKIGYSVDFCMRASIPACLCLFGMVTDAIEDYISSRRYVLLSLLLCLMVIGSAATFDTLYGTISRTVSLQLNNEKVTTGIINEKAVMTVHNFSSGMDSFFYKYMARGGQ